MFDEFQYCLNLGPYQHKQLPNSNKPTIASILITPQTDIQSSAYFLCYSNNLSQSLIPILIQSIQSQILQQIQLYKQNKKKNMIKINQNDNKSKKFKNKFCQYLNQMDKQYQNYEDESFYRKKQNQNEQYSFRPTYMKILELADQEEHNYDRKDKKLIKINKQNQLQSQQNYNKPLLTHKKSQRNVFEQLYSQYRAIQQKKQQKRKKSVQKLTFIPQINKMSRKIIQMKKNHNITNTNQSIQRPIKNLQFSNISTIKNSRSTISIKFKPQNSQQQIKQLNNPVRNPLKELNIYQRGQVYLHKSRQKRDILNKLQILKQLQNCTFKPKILRKSKSKSRIKMY